MEASRRRSSDDPGMSLHPGISLITDNYKLSLTSRCFGKLAWSDDQISMLWFAGWNALAYARDQLTIHDKSGSGDHPAK